MVDQTMAIVNYKALGRAVKEARQQVGLSQLELAERCQLSRSYIANFETGKMKPSLDALAKIAEECQLPVAALVDRSKSLSLDVDGLGETVSSVVDTTVEQVDRIVSGVRRLRELPGYGKKVYAKMERRLAEELSELLGVPVDELYREGAPLFAGEDLEDEEADPISEVLSSLEEFRLVGRKIRVAGMVKKADRLLSEVDFADLKGIFFEIAGVDPDNSETYPRDKGFFSGIVNHEHFFKAEEDEALRCEWLRSMIIDQHLFGFPVYQLSPNEIKERLQEIVGDKFELPFRFPDFPVWDDWIDAYRRVRSALIQYIAKTSEPVDLSEFAEELTE